MSKEGKLLGVVGRLHEHEVALIDFLLQHGFDVTVLPPSRVKNARTPDFLINDFPWEAKTLFKARRQTVQHAFKSALKQAPNIIFDLRFLRADAQTAMRHILHEYNHNKNVRRLMIVGENGDLSEYIK